MLCVFVGMLRAFVGMLCLFVGMLRAFVGMLCLFVGIVNDRAPCGHFRPGPLATDLLALLPQT
jgi:hypothetical protein